jgi:hypothetical protein
MEKINLKKIVGSRKKNFGVSGNCQYALRPRK